jgi:hypothetical protein
MLSHFTGLANDGTADNGADMAESGVQTTATEFVDVRLTTPGFADINLRRTG